jgi:hypothetical protein
MKRSLVALIVFSGLALGAALAQDPQTAAQTTGQRPDFGGGPGMRGGWGSGITGTVTEVAADHYLLKSDTGPTYTVHFSANTHILKQTARQPGAGSPEGGPGRGAPPQVIKSSEIKVGDAVAVMGEVDATAKSVGATVIVQIDPERARQMREMKANYGKTWLMGKVTAIAETKVTIQGMDDATARIFVADENTTFRKRRDPIILADLQVGDMVRVEGAIKNGNFIATTVNVMGMPQGGTPTMPRNTPQQ